MFESERPKPLTATQKGVLCQLCGRAWNRCGAAMGYADVTEFRHACVFDVTAGKDGLTACDQLDYIPLFNYFGAMLGMPPREDKTPRTALERALGVLRDALQRWEFTEGYAAAIMRDRLGALWLPGMPFEYMASMLKAEGVRQVTYTVINRGRERVRRAAENNGFDLPEEPHHSPSTLPPGGLAEHFNAVLVKSPAPRKQRRSRKEATHA